MQRKIAAALLATTFATVPALAGDGAEQDSRMAELEARLEAQEARILQLERELLAATAAPVSPPRTQVEGQAGTVRVAGSPSPSPMPAVATAAPASPSAPALSVSGDLRLRYEHNGSDNDAPDDGRGVIRARIRAGYQVNDWLQLGAQLATGSQDDPNTTDVTLGNFNDDLEVSLDQAYAHVSRGGLDIWGGKFPQVFRRTDLVWDGDVSPQGLAARYRVPLAEGLSLGATGIYFPIDRSVDGPDSTMTGGQVELAADGAAWSAAIAAAYYDYRLGSVASADAGDFRGNLLRPDGRYLSDFDLVDVIAEVRVQPWDARWPISLTADYVKNFGAATGADSGYSAALAIGRAEEAGDLRFGYAYSQAEADAVFAAFSHDNINIATNYRLHALSADYAYRDDLMFNATLYLYRPDEPLHAGANDPGDWLSRFRLNALVTF